MLQRLRKLLLTGLVAVSLPWPALLAGEPTTVPPGKEVKVEVKAAEPATPTVTLTLGPRHGHVTPVKHGFAKTAAGNIDVAQPAPDTVVITATGLTLAGASPICCSDASIQLDLTQCFEVVFEKPEVRQAKLSIEGRMVGLLRSHCKGSVGVSDLNACISAGEVGILSLNLPGRSIAGCENVSINNHNGPVCALVGPGKLTLHESFEISAHHPRCTIPLLAGTAEFAPDPALNPIWIDLHEPFHGAEKKNLGVQITIKVVEETVQEAGKEPSAADAPKPMAPANGEIKSEVSPAPKP